jgi:hypothetical protein
MTDSRARRPEHWLPVVGYEGLYEVSDLGKVRSLRDGQLLSLYVVDDYPMVTLHKGGKQKTRHVHRLVLEAFAGPCLPGQQARHGRSGPDDNCWPENLEWGTAAQNAIDKVRHAIAAGQLDPELVRPRAVHVSESTWLRVAEAAEAEGRSRNEVVLDALDQYLARHGGHARV